MTATSTLDRDAMNKGETREFRKPTQLKLIGSYFSPYTRRVAVSLDALDQPYEFEAVSVMAEQQKVQAHNPVIRIPVVLMPDGEVLIESYAILDEIDQRVGPDRALIPHSGASRRRVMQVTALALACMEKAQWAFYEGRFRPDEKVFEPWVRHNDNQVTGGLRFLDGTRREARSRRLARRNAGDQPGRYHHDRRLQLYQYDKVAP